MWMGERLERGGRELAFHLRVMKDKGGGHGECGVSTGKWILSFLAGWPELAFLANSNSSLSLSIVVVTWGQNESIRSHRGSNLHQFREGHHCLHYHASSFSFSLTIVPGRDLGPC